MDQTRIMIVEDEFLVASDIKESLENLGYSVTSIVTSGEKTLENAYKEKPDLILMDIMLGGELDGIETAKLIRRHHNIPVVFLTAHANEDIIKRAKISEPFGCILKPFEEKELHITIEVALYKAKMEEELQASKERYRLLVETMNEGLGVLSKEGILTFVNDKFCKILGYTREDILGKSITDFLKESYKDTFRNQENRYLKSSYGSNETEWIRKDGEIAYTLMSSPQDIYDENGNFVGSFAVIMDITERKKTEKALRESEEKFLQAQKMEAIGRLAGGVSHDFNNLLTAIIGYANMMMINEKLDDSLKTDVSEIRKSAKLAVSLTQQLLAFSRRQVLQPKIIILNNLISDLEKMLKRLIGEDVQLETDLDPTLGLTKADHCQTEQIIMNLIVNARDALPKGGKITIKTRNANLDDDFCKRHDLEAREYVMLSVSDTGCGMDEETQSKIFEPFFTTKTRGKGTGLGLSTVFGIAKQSGGHIVVESKLGQGTTFKIYLPQVEKAAQDSVKIDEPLTIPSGSESILLVEDDESVRKMEGKFLKKYGYKIYEAATADRAIQMCKNNSKSKINLLITDVIMPDMTGPELAKKLMKMNPDIRILYTSGYMDNEIVKGILLNKKDVFLRKPFSPVELASIVRKVLNDASLKSIHLE